MIIADHPLHRSGRAALPHPAPTSGDDAQTLGRIGMAGSFMYKTFIYNTLPV
jgi:hypothetical protein